MKYALVICLNLVLGLNAVHAGQCYAPIYKPYYKPYVAPYYQAVYFLVAPEIRQDAVAEKVADKIAAKYEARIQSLQAQLSGKVCVEFGGAGGNTTTSTTTPATADVSAAQAVLNTNCIRCHQGPGSKGGDKDFRNVMSLDELTRHKIFVRAQLGTMPPKGEGSPITDADVQALLPLIK